MSRPPKVTTKRLRDYLQKGVKKGRLRFIHREATNIKIESLSKLGGGISNDIYTFSLTYLNERKIQELKLVLKIYREGANVKCRNESQILSALERKNFPVPHLYIRESNEDFLGAPFIVMDKVEGKPMGDYIKKVCMEKKLDVIRRFAKTLSLLHELRWKDFELNFLRFPIDEYYYATQQAVLMRHLAKYWNVKQDLDWAIDWLDAKASLHPCYHYSLLHGDMHLNNFLVTAKGRVFVVDWEYPEVGDALKDVGLAYHNLSLTFGKLLHNVNEGKKIGKFFVQQYIKNSSRKIKRSTLHFYMFTAALLEALGYRFRSVRALNPLFVKQILGRKYIPIFPILWWHFRSKAKILERFLIGASTTTHMINHVQKTSRGKRDNYQIAIRDCSPFADRAHTHNAKVCVKQKRRYLNLS